MPSCRQASRKERTNSLLPACLRLGLLIHSLTRLTLNQVVFYDQWLLANTLLLLLFQIDITPLGFYVLGRVSTLCRVRVVKRKAAGLFLFSFFFLPCAATRDPLPLSDSSFWSFDKHQTTPALHTFLLFLHVSRRRRRQWRWLIIPKLRLNPLRVTVVAIHHQTAWYVINNNNKSNNSLASRKVCQTRNYRPR